MAKRSWTNEELRSWMVEVDFPDYEDCGHFTSVVYNGAWTTLTFLRKKEGVSGSEEDRPSYAVVSSVREFTSCHGGGMQTAGYTHEPKMVKALTKEEGNLLWRAIKATQRTSRKNTIYFDLGKALDRIPSNSTLANKFVG